MWCVFLCLLPFHTANVVDNLWYNRKVANKHEILESESGHGRKTELTID